MSNTISNRARKRRNAKRQSRRQLRNLLEWRAWCSRIVVTVEAVEEFSDQWRLSLRRAFQAVGPYSPFAAVTLETGSIDLFDPHP